jgi:hypothetical protein
MRFDDESEDRPAWTQTRWIPNAGRHSKAGQRDGEGEVMTHAVTAHAVSSLSLTIRSNGGGSYER